MKRVVSISVGLGCLLILAPLVFWACRNTTTPVDQLSDCQRHQTGTLSISNKSTLGLDYDIILDGTSQGRLAAGTTKEYPVGEGPHNVEFKYFDFSQDACAVSYFYITKCQTTSLSCTT